VRRSGVEDISFGEMLAERVRKGKGKKKKKKKNIKDKPDM
jgi:predicted DNA-binding protein